MQNDDVFIAIMKQECYNTLLLKAVLQTLLKNNTYINVINEINEEISEKFKEVNNE